MNRFLSILKRVGGVAATVAPVAGTLIGGPAMGALITTAITAVVQAEKPGVSGPDKHVAAVQSMFVAAPAIISLIESATGKELVDDALFESAMKRLVDAAVDLLNAFGVLPRKGA